MRKRFLLAACLAALATAQAAEVRKVMGPGGKVMYTNMPAPIPDVLPPNVVAAVSNVFMVSHLVSRGREFCGGAFPANVGRYASSAQSWQQRNSAVIHQKDRVMAHGDQPLVASALIVDARRKTDGMLEPLLKASNAERSKWCSQAFADVDRGTLDLVGRASIAPLMALSR